LVYEYDTYADARRDFPRVKEPLQALDGDYYLVKSDILARTMQFSSSKDALVNVVTLSIDRVKEIQALNRAGKKVSQLLPDDNQTATTEEPTYRSEEDSITRFDNKRRNRDRRRRGDRNQNQSNQNSAQQPQPATENATKTERPARETTPRDERRNRPRPERKSQSPSQGEAQPSSVAETQPSRQSQGERPARDRQRWNRRDRQNRRSDNRTQGENADNRAQQRGGEENRQRGERNNAKGEASTPKPNKTE
jgi:hypothetical protein